MKIPEDALQSFVLYSADVENLASWQPPEGEPWEVNVQVFVEPGPGEAFQFQLRSLPWLQARLAHQGAVLTGRSMFVERYDYELVERAVAQAVAECRTSDWDTFAASLNTYMEWEFENYKE